MPAHFKKEEIPADVGGDGMGLFIFIVASHAAVALNIFNELVDPF